MLRRLNSAFNVLIFLTVCNVLFVFNDSLLSQSNATLGLGLNSLGVPVTPLFDTAGNHLQITNGQIASDFKLMPRSYRHEMNFDSTGTYVVVEESLLKEPFNLTHKISLDEYLKYAQDNRESIYWNKQTQRYLSGELNPRSSNSTGLEITVPVKIKSKAFQTIFGGDRVKLSVNGNINIKGGFRHEDRDQVKTMITDGSDFNFKMEQTQQFQVQGHIGEKVTVSVDQNSERAFDFENTLKLTYTGYDDEIIQSIEAGNVSLSLPATRFISYSNTNSGLFGIKMVAQLGNLSMTAITSQEKGESQELSVTGGAVDSEPKQIWDYNYVKNKYFFLGKEYLENYWPADENGYHTNFAEFEIQRLEVYKSDYGYENDPQVIKAWALNDSLIRIYSRGEELASDVLTSSNPQIGKELYNGYFKRLELNRDYFFNPISGVISFSQTLSENEVIGVAYSYGTTQVDSIGDLVATGNDDVFLKLIKTRTARPEYSTWELMLRNIYSIGRNTSPDDFEVKVFRVASDGTDQEVGNIQGTESETASYLNIMGLDVVNNTTGASEPDNQVDMRETTVRTTEGVIELPFLRPFDPNEGESNIKLADEDRCEFYDEINSTQIQQASKFYFEVTAAGTRSTTYQLGFNVIESSEQVYFNNQLLSKGTDYIIDYITGTMTILREGADDASANIKITYQRNQFFQLEKRTLMGTNLKYQLWNEESFLGGTFLYLNESTLDQKVRVGEGPKQNMVWDLNTKMTLKPAFLTKVVDALPLIRTKAESRLNFEAEVARSIPNPNTLNNSATGDNDGVAYIDDFESVKRETPLGVTRRSWYPASCPADSNLTELANSRASKKGSLYWYNPEYQVYIKDIWPNQDINGNVAQRVNVLNLDFDPTVALQTDDLSTNWSGVMRPLSAGYANQTESKFIEIMLKCPQLKGQLHIDMGQVSEDMIPNYSESFDMYFPTLNTEDVRVDGYANKLLDDGEDIGLDMMSGSDGEDWWDLNGDGIRQEDMEPLSSDDWDYSQGSNSYANINGTENSAKDYGARVPDTEDINNNSTLDTQNDYFEYRMDLDPSVDKQTKQYVQGGDLEGLPTGWRLYRIPLEDYYKKEGEPRFDLIEFVRIWIDGVDEPIQIQIAEINIVGNMWLEGGVYIPVDTLSADSLSYEYNFFPSNTDTVITTVVNTHDNSEEYFPQETGVSGVIDKVSQVEAREQSLVLRINNNLPPQAEGIAQKTLMSSLDFNNYNRMKMFVHGGNGMVGSELNFPNGELEYFVRFGLNSSNYYEYRTNIFFGWDTRNHMDIDLGTLSSMKENISTVKYLTVNSTQIHEVKEDTVWVDDEFYYILRVVNNPSLSNIKQMTIGVKNCSGNTLTLEPGMEPIEVWFNEFRLSEVKKESGLALRASLDLGLADVFSGNVQITQKSANFILISDRFGSGSNKLSTSYSGTMRFGKFFPSQWGISIPVNFNYSVSEGTPKYLSGSDILFEDLVDQARKDAEVNYSQSEGWGISFKKTTRSKKFIVKNTLDKLSLNYSNSKSNSHNASTKKRTSEMHKAGVNYRLDFGRNNYTKPFSFLKKTPLLGGLGDLKLYYTPSNVSLGISGTHNKNFSETRPSDDPLGDGSITNTRKINLSRNIQASYKIMESLNLSYTRTLRDDFANAQEADSTLQIKDILKGQFGTKTADTQAFTTKFNPKLAKWFTMNLSYGANFNWANQIQSGDLGRSTTSKNTYSANVNFNPSQMFRSVFKIKPTSNRSSNRNRSQRRTPGQKDDKPDGEGAPKKKQKEGPSFAMRGLSWFTGVWQPITGTYTRSDNTSLRAIEDKFPSTAFQFFALADPGVMMVDSSQVRSNSYAFTQNYSLGTGIKPTRNMSLTFKYNYREGRNETSQITGNYQQSAFDGVPFPTWQFRWTGIEKLFFFKKFANRISLDHKYTGSFTEKWTDSPANVTSQVISNKYNPVIGLNLTLKKNISVSVSYNMDETTNNSLGLTNSGSRSENSNFALKASYNKRGGMKLSVWPFKNKELKNTVDMSLTVSATSSKSFAKPEGKWVIRDSSSKIEFKPQVRYSFSSLVTGGTYLTISQQKNKRIGNTAIQEFGLDVNISIRGN